MDEPVLIIPLIVAAVAVGGGRTMGFEIKSPAFTQSGMIPRKHTCDGPDVSPALEWTGVPEGAKTLALICDDPDAPVGTWVHWVLYNLPAHVTNLPEGVPTTEKIDQGASQGTNDFGRIGYGGPCPPPGTPHRYLFKLYALDDKIPLAPGTKKKEVMKALENHIIGQSEIMGKFGR
jgi:Raf kinase inhibitor-like YbhB/YbcL family protein